jgi:membrane protein
MTKLERIILTSAPVRFLARKSKRIILPGFIGLPLYDVWKFFMRQVRTVGLNERAAAIAFNFLMALPAALLVLFTLIPYLPISKQITNELLTLTKDLTPNQLTTTILGILKDFLNKPKGSLSIFVFLLVIFYSSNAMMGIMRSFNRSFTTRKMNFIASRWTAIRLTGLLMLLVIATIIVLFTQGQLLKLLMQWMEIKSSGIKWLIKSLRWIVIIALFFYSIAFIYRYAPAVHKKWKLSSPGAILATFLMIMTTWVFSFWVNNFASYNKIYGSIGTVLILMGLIFFNSLVLLIGFELNVSITHLRRIADERAQSETDGVENDG